MLVEAQGVINMRMMGMAGLVPSHADEGLRMVAEKHTVFMESALAGTGALLAGKTPAQAYGLALTPIGRTTHANSKRLTAPS
ncbi:antifreeze protein [Jannaschia faecimaris]|nr:antifreeze protein [Jannaschia faecimaris]